jgi:hypothetical protein
VVRCIEYEVWAADQSNTAPNQSSLGVKGGYLWIWKGEDIETQVNDGSKIAVPLSCTLTATTGPCDLLEVFPPTLVADSTNAPLSSFPGFGRFHGVLIDPQQRYATVSMFTGGGGYIGIMDTTTREAIALFRATAFNTARSVHMNFWSAVS